MSPPRAKKRKVSENAEDSDNAEEPMDMSDEEGALRVDGIYIPPPPKPPVTLEREGSRLIITKIENYFFKSYANKKILGPFHKRFNAIVGPNGSGKSNVIDAMLFVFGYRASKIRSKKISVLLHNSQYYPNVQSCTVSVHFAVIIDKEGEDFDIVPNSKFAVSRTANKDNSSYYQLNDRRVQFKEIAKLLRNYGIDLDHNRFLILQGEVEQIAMMKCKAQNEHESGMLEYLEDIIGTSRFKRPIVELSERLDILSSRRSEKLNRVKLVESELGQLKEPMEEAVEFLELENSLTQNKNFLYQWQIFNLSNKVKDIEEEKREVAAAQEQLVERLSDIAKRKAEKEKILKEGSKKHDELEKRKDKLKDAFNRANNKDMQLQADMSQLNKTRKKTNELLNEERKKLAKLQAVPEENAKSITECENKEQQLSIKKEKLDAEKSSILENLRSETQELQEEKEILQTELVELNKVVDETKSAFDLAESELKIYVSNEENEKKKLETLNETYRNIKQIIQERTQQINELKKKIPLTEKSLQSAKQELHEIKVKETEQMNEMNKKRASLTEVRMNMQASQSRGKVLNSLMQQKHEGNCTDLFGRLGDLGAIDHKYDVAISTACGALDNLVVIKVLTAQWCIEFLRHNDVGKATFIVLEKQDYLRDRATKTIKTPEDVPRLFDLVRINDDRLRTAFYYALRDTLVAKDLDQGSRIAYGSTRYRVVTLSGQVYEMTGTLSGGGKTVCKGRMGQSVVETNLNPKDIQKKEADLENMNVKLSQLRQKKVNLENQIKVLEPELQQMKIDLEKYSSELQSVRKQEPTLAQQVKAQELKSKTTKADQNVVKKLTKVIDGARAKYENASEVSGRKQAKVDELTAEIKAKTAGKLKSIDKKLKEVTNTIDKCKAEITSLKVGIKTAERNAKNTAQKIINMEQDVTEAENKLRAMKAEREEIEKDGKEFLTAIESISVQLTETQEEFADEKGEVAALTKQENQLKSDKIEIDQKCKTFDDAITQKQANIHQYRAKLTHLKLQDIPDKTVEELKTYTPEELTARDVQHVQNELHSNEEQLKIAKPNLNAIEDYRKKQLVYIERSKELDEISQKKATVKDTLDNVKQKRKDEFMTGYQIIRLKLKEMYQMITLGGDADFELVDTFNPFSEGIQFNVRPPKKSWKNISNLSGGEKTLSSLALVFALHYYKPSPLYVMDEIDAALDFKNVSIVANYIKERTKNAQFIIISLRPNMFELCDHMIGIYKNFDCTKTVCIDPNKFRSDLIQQTPRINHVNVIDDAEKEMPNSDNGILQEGTSSGSTSSVSHNGIDKAGSQSDETECSVIDSSLIEQEIEPHN